MEGKGNNLIKKSIAVAVILLFFSVSVIPSVPSEQTSTGDIISVDDEGDGDYTSIKEAVNNANPGDTIEVYSGTYYEHNIWIETEEIILKGISHELGTGNDTGKPLIDGQGLSPGLLFIGTEGVTVTGFHIENDGTVFCLTISLFDANNCLISENDLSHALFAPINCKRTTNVTIMNNNISHCTMRQGICLIDCNNNIVSGNTITDISLEGILLWTSHHTLVSYNKISRCNRDGICILGDFNTIYRNHIEDNKEGLYIGDGIFNIIIQNNFINNLRNAYCDLGFGFYPAFLNRWINNYWDDWNGIGPKRIPGRILIFIPRPNFDWRPAQEPYKIGV